MPCCCGYLRLRCMLHVKRRPCLQGDGNSHGPVRRDIGRTSRNCPTELSSRCVSQVSLQWWALTRRVLGSEMLDFGEKIGARAAVCVRGPSDDLGAPAEQRKDPPVPVGSGLETALHTPAACRARPQLGFPGLQAEARSRRIELAPAKAGTGSRSASLRPYCPDTKPNSKYPAVFTGCSPSTAGDRFYRAKCLTVEVHCPAGTPRNDRSKLELAITRHKEACKTG